MKFYSDEDKRLFASPEKKAEIYARVERLVSNSGRTMADLAREFQMCVRVVYSWRKRGIPEKYVEPICEKFNVSRDYILHGASEGTNPGAFVEAVSSKEGLVEPNEFEEGGFDVKFGSVESFLCSSFEFLRRLSKEDREFVGRAVFRFSLQKFNGER